MFSFKLNKERALQVNATELRQHLNEYLECASCGQSLDITMRGKPVARLTRIEAKTTSTRDDLFGIWSDIDKSDASAQALEMRQGCQL